MTTVIPRYTPTTIEIKQFPRPARLTDLDDADGAILVCDSERLRASEADFPYFRFLKHQFMRRFGDVIVTTPRSLDLPNKCSTRLTVFGLSPKLSAFALLSLCRTAVAQQREFNPRVLTLCLVDLEPEANTRVLAALAASLHAALHSLPSFKSKRDQPKQLAFVRAVGMPTAIDLRRAVAVAHGNNLARHFTALPPNRLTPGAYRDQIRVLAKARGWRMTVLDTKKLQKIGAGAFLAVAQGSNNPDASIIRLEYRPKRRAASAPHVALVGKGICFDTGGNNLKPAKFMHGMHEDMQGSAVALGTLWTLTELAYPHPVDCWVALAENMIGPAAYKQNDIFTACNGTTIEIIHTDAEGRMVLADTLALAARTNPSMIIDYATLTGSCIGALGTRYSGVFTNRNDWTWALAAAGERSGERVWPFPADDDYAEALVSHVADVKQCTLDNNADHILAALFLKRFIGQTPWIHLDLAAGNHPGGLAHIPTDITGFGVGFSTEFLIDRDNATDAGPGSPASAHARARKQKRKRHTSKGRPRR